MVSSSGLKINLGCAINKHATRVQFHREGYTRVQDLKNTEVTGVHGCKCLENNEPKEEEHRIRPRPKNLVEEGAREELGAAGGGNGG